MSPFFRGRSRRRRLYRSAGNFRHLLPTIAAEEFAMTFKLLSVTALAIVPLVAYVAGSVEARRPAPIRWVDSERTNVRVEILVEGAPAVVYRDGDFRWIEG